MDLREHKPSAKRMLACLLTMCVCITATSVYIGRFSIVRTPEAEASRIEAKAVLGTLQAGSGSNELSVLIEKRLQEVAEQDKYSIWTGQDSAGSPIVLAAVGLERKDGRTWAFESATRARVGEDGVAQKLAVKRADLATSDYLQQAIADDLRVYARDAGGVSPSFQSAATNEGVIIMVAPDAARVVAGFSLVLAQNKNLPIGDLLTKLIAAI